MVEKVPIVGDGDNSAGVLLEMLLKPQHALGVEVVSGLVEQQQVGLLQQQLAQSNSPFFAAREVCHHLVARRAPQRVHRLLELRVEIPSVLRVELFLQRPHLGKQGIKVGVGVSHGERDFVKAVQLVGETAHAVLHILKHGFRLVELGLLHEDSDRVARAQPRLAVRGGVEPRHDLYYRGLTRAIRADHADLRTREERHCDVIEDDLVADRLAGADHGVDEFGHVLSLERACDPPCTGPTREHRRAASRERPQRPARAGTGRR